MASYFHIIENPAFSLLLIVSFFLWPTDSSAKQEEMWKEKVAQTENL